LKKVFLPSVGRCFHGVLEITEIAAPKTY
jgi:hypothetical protein